jgi:uncharacterized protein
MLDVRKAAGRGVSIRGALKPLDLQRFRSLLADDSGSIQAEFTFSRDEENRYLIQLALAAEVVVTCQRCLEPLSIALACDTTLAVVWTDEQAGHLPRHLEPLVVAGEGCKLWDVVEDELILVLPPFSYHETQECRQKLAQFNAGQSSAEGASPAEKPNPFNVLAQFKPGGKT